MVMGSTGTGLDRLIALIGEDEGLAARLPPTEVAAGAAAADQMNVIIVEGIATLGVGIDGVISAGDVRTLSDWVRADGDRKDRFIDLHGDDEGREETGFHRVQNDGAVIHLFGRNAVNTVADGLYHLPFGYDKGRIVNEDGNRNADLEDMARWLNELLADDLAAAAANGTGTLASPTDPKAVTTSGTGLDQLVQIILDDPGLNRKIPTTELQEGAQAAADLNAMITAIIVEQGLANDGKITASDVYDINAAIQGDPALYARFIDLHGDDEGREETGFHLVQNDGATTRHYADNAVNTVADGIYHIGFDIERGRFLNEDGNKNASVKTVANWIDLLLAEDLAAGTLANPAVDPLPGGVTGTGLDRLVEIIEGDIGLERKIATADIAGGADAANTLNQLILDGIQATGVANNGQLTAADLRDVNAWIRADADRYTAFVDAHGDDEGREETGFHLVQNDGAVSRLFGENAVNTIADGIYHVGFEIERGRFLNEDGNRNQSVEDVAAWLEALLSEADLAALENQAVEAYVDGSTGTDLDRLIDILNADPGLANKIATSEIAGGAKAADQLNQMILEGIHAVGAANDGAITGLDVREINAWIRGDAARLEEFIALHGDDERGSETGFHLVQNDGAVTHLLGRNAVNTVMDGLYHIGFAIERDRFLNEDGKKNASVTSVADWLNDILADDIASGSLSNPAFDPANADLAALSQSLVFSGPDVTVGAGGEGHVVLEHAPDLALSQGSVVFAFTAETPEGRDKDVLLSKDGSGYQDGGHTTIWVQRGDLYARFQTDTDQVTLKARDVVETGQEHAVGFTFDGTTAKLYLDGVLLDTEASTATWLGNDEQVALGANIWGRSDSRPDWVGDFHKGTVTGLKIYDTVLSSVEIQAVTGISADGSGLAGESPFGAPAGLPVGTTGTGLDQLVEIITGDVGLARRISVEDIAGGAEAADAMNGLIVAGLQATGLANDGAITAADVRDLSDWVQAHHKDAFVTYHGDDERGEETGFHLVQNDGAQTRLFGDNAVNTVADGLYHLPFGTEKGRIINEDGNRNATLEDMAWWLEALLDDELNLALEEQGPLYSATIDPTGGIPMTGTGFDLVTEIILNDPGLLRKVSHTDQVEAAKAGAVISQMILDAIEAYGLADDGAITASDMHAVNSWIQADPLRYDAFVTAHGDDERREETGFHRVQNDGAETYLFARNAVNTIFDGIFHVGFDIERGRFLNEDGNRNASVDDVAYWVDQILADDLASGALDTGTAPTGGTTGTGLDLLVATILDDPGLERKASELDIRAGAAAADALNEMIVEAVKDTGVAINGTITAADVRDLNGWFQADEDRYDRFVFLHGDDERREETGFHRVQNDGGTSRLFGDKAVDTVADGIYHIGFDIERGRFLNEDGNKNASVKTVAGWLDSIFTDDDLADIAALSTVNPYISGSTGTGLDQLVEIITNDDGLINRISTTDIKGGAEAADALNHILVDLIKQTGAANDGVIGTYDLTDINALVRQDPDLLARFTALHGDDERGEETGFHRVQNDGAATELFDKNAVNTVADGIYHFGFDIERGRFLNEDGNKNASVKAVAGWLNQLLADDLAAETLVNPDLLPSAVDPADLLAKQLLAITDPITVTAREGSVEFDSSPDLALTQATVLIGFTADDIDRDRDTLFSRDGSGYQDGGHLTLYTQGDDLVARFQSDSKSIYLKAKDAIAVGEDHDAAFTFDGSTAKLYLDGQLRDVESFSATWAQADEALRVGGSLMYRRDGQDRIDDRFEGVIDSFRLFNDSLAPHEIQAAALLDDDALIS